MFAWMQATDWRFLPADLLAQPAWLMDDLFTLRSEYEIIKEATKK